MRITVQHSPNAVTMKLEGRVAGPWAGEFGRAWHDLAPSLGYKKLFLDLCGVTFVDENGRKLLAEIYGETKAEILADSPLTKYFAEEAKRKISKNGKEGG